MKIFLVEAEKADTMLQTIKANEDKFKKTQIEKTYLDLTKKGKDYSGMVNSKKKSRTKHYYILNRVVSPLIIAEERIVHSFDPHTPATPETQGFLQIENIQDSFEKLSLVEELPGTKLPAKTVKSACIKRSFIEMQKTQSSRHDVFSAPSLKSIFAYIDYEAMKLPKIQYIVTGHFAAVVFEVYFGIFIIVDYTSNIDRTE